MLLSFVLHGSDPVVWVIICRFKIALVSTDTPHTLHMCWTKFSSSKSWWIAFTVPELLVSTYGTEFGHFFLMRAQFEAPGDGGLLKYLIGPLRDLLLGTTMFELIVKFISSCAASIKYESNFFLKTTLKGSNPSLSYNDKSSWSTNAPKYQSIV